MRNRLIYGACEPNILNFIDAEKIKKEEQKTIVIVPDQYKLEMEQLLGEKFGGVLLHVSVMSLTGLAKRVAAHEDIVPITALGRQMFISAAMDSKRRKLRAFSRNRNKRGFIEELDSILSEMTQPIDTSGIDNETLADKVADINVIYEAYREITAGKYVGDENLMVRAAELAQHSAIVIGTRFFIAKYTHFTDSEQLLFRALLEFSAGVEMTLHYAEGRRVFAYTKRLMDELPSGIAAVEADSDECGEGKGRKIAEAIFAQDAGGLAEILKDSMSESGGTIKYDSSFLEVYEAESRKAEMVFAASRIHRLLAAGAQLSEITIVCPKLESYLGLIEYAMGIYDIPYFIDSDRTFPQNPLKSFVDALLEYSVSPSREAVLKMLRTELLPLTEAENYRLLLDITEKRFSLFAAALQAGSEAERERKAAVSGVNFFPALDARDTEFSADGAGDYMGFDGGLHDRLRSMLAELNLRHIFRGEEVEIGEFVRELYAVLTKPLVPGGGSVMSRCEQHSYKLGRLSGETSFEMEFGARIWNAFIETLRQLSELAGVEQVRRAPFSRIRSLIIAHMSKVSVARIPSHTEYVTIAPLGRVRAQRAKYVVLVGAVRGELPNISARTKVLSLDEQNTLLGSGRVRRFKAFEDAEREAYQIYALLIAPQNKLIITYPDASKSVILGEISAAAELLAGKAGLRFPTADPEGKPRRDAEYYKKFLEPVRLSPDGARRLLVRGRSIKSSDSALAVADGGLASAGGGLAAVDCGFAFVKGSLASAKGGFVSVDDDSGREQNFLRISLSSSGIDEYLNCPYKYMLHRLLGIGTLEVSELNSLEAGNITHYVLDKYAKKYWTNGSEVLSNKAEVFGNKASSGACNAETGEGDTCFSVANLVAEGDAYFSVAHLADEIEKMDSAIRERVRGLLASASRVGISSAMYRKRFEDAVTMYIKALEYQLAMGKYDLVQSEQIIAFTEVLTAENGKKIIIDFSGKADRMDFSASGKYYRLIDYKTGKEQIGVKKFFELEYTQLMLYMYALGKTAPDRVCAGMYIFNSDDRRHNKVSAGVSGKGESGSNESGSGSFGSDEYGLGLSGVDVSGAGDGCEMAEGVSDIAAAGVALEAEDIAAAGGVSYAGVASEAVEHFKSYRLNGVSLADDDAAAAMCRYSGYEDTVCGEDKMLSDANAKSAQKAIYEAAIKEAEEQSSERVPLREYLKAIGTAAFSNIIKEYGAVESGIIFDFSQRIIHSVAAEIADRRFEVQPGNHCVYCNYKAMCRGGGIESNG